MINIEKFICSIMEQQSEYHNAPINRSHIQEALREQGYEYNNGAIVKISADWKPSKEQMEALFTASERNDKLGSILNSLYYDLKNNYSYEIH